MLSFSAREFLKRLIKFAEIDDVNGRIVRYSQHSDYIDKHFYVLLELIKADEFIISQNNKDIVLLDNALIYPRQSRTRFALLCLKSLWLPLIVSVVSSLIVYYVTNSF